MSALAGFGLASGAVAGVLHVLTGPDHLVAVAPLSISRARGGWAVGAAWGLGHWLGTAFLVLVALTLRGLLPVDEWFGSLSAFAESVVGFMLLGLGGRGLWCARTSRPHVHEHFHDGRVNRHPHLHRAVGVAVELVDLSIQNKGHAKHLHLPAGIGCVHGIAGGGALLWLLPSLGLPNWQMAAYLIGFGIAGIGAMAMFANFMAMAGRRGALRYSGFYPLALRLSSVLAMLVGGLWLTK